MMQATDLQPLSETEVAQRLSAFDILPTPQRVKIAQVMLVRDQHLSAEQVLERVNQAENCVSKATVYNTLGLFARKGILREVIVDPTRVFYDTNSRPHHHFYHVDTGELQDIMTDQLGLEGLPDLPPGTVAEGVDIIVRVRRGDEAD